MSERPVPGPDVSASDDLRDPHIDALWRAASREEPPAALDAKLLAAAHREARSVPRPAESKVAEATRPERWWWPLAAAATIGAIAFGVLQLQPVEPNEPAVVSDMSPRTVARSNAGGQEPAFVPDAVQAPATPPAQRKAQEESTQVREQSFLADSSARTPAPSPVFRNERQRTAAENKLAARAEADTRSANAASPTSEGAARAKTESKPAPVPAPPGPTPIPTDSANLRAPTAPPPIQAMQAQPPAQAPSAAPPAAASRAQAAGDDKMTFVPPPPAAAPAASMPAAGAMAPVDEASAGLARKEATLGAAQKIEGERRASSSAIQKRDVDASPPAVQTTQPAAPGRAAASSAPVAQSAPAFAAAGKDATSSVPLGNGATPLATPGRAATPSAPLAKARVAGSSDRADGGRVALPVSDWIALIRRLRAEGRIEEAGKELAAFRSAHPDDAERLLPQDLREWRPAKP